MPPRGLKAKGRIVAVLGIFVAYLNNEAVKIKNNGSTRSPDS
jgi:hypothetical protein